MPSPKRQASIISLVLRREHIIILQCFLFSGRSPTAPIWLYCNSLQSRSHAAENFICNRFALLRHIAHRNFLILRSADYNSADPLLNIRNFTDVHQRLIHADTADDRRPAAVDQNSALSLGKRTRQPIGIADRE